MEYERQAVGSGRPRLTRESSLRPDSSYLRNAWFCLTIYYLRWTGAHDEVSPTGATIRILDARVGHIDRSVERWPCARRSDRPTHPESNAEFGAQIADPGFGLVHGSHGQAQLGGGHLIGLPLPRWLGIDITGDGDWRSRFPWRGSCCLATCSSDSSWMPRCPSSSAFSWSRRSIPRNWIGCSRAPRRASTPASCSSPPSSN